MNDQDAMQLVDEFSMIYTTCLMCYATFSYSRSAFFKASLGLGLTALAVFISLYYHHLQDPVFHQNAYAVLTVIVLLKMIHLMEITLRPKSTQSMAGVHTIKYTLNGADAGKINGDASTRDRQILMKMWELFAYGLSIFLVGFFLWGLDNKYCASLRTWRHRIGLPWGFVLEGHGWWHAGTAYGAFCFLCVASLRVFPL